jgi:hypothetical protein
MTKFLRSISLSLSSLVVLFFCVNCGEGFVAIKLNDNINLFSLAPGETCEESLVRVYSNTYHPFLSQTCKNCHVDGPGIGTFASADVMNSYLSFSSIGAEKINSQALNANHKPPYTGPVNASKINKAKTDWAAAQVGYASCIASEGGATTSKYQVISISKVVPANISTTFQRMEWDLGNENLSALPLVAGIEIRKYELNGSTKGYEFRNPTLRLKSENLGAYNARSLYLNINDVQNTEISTYMNIDKNITTATDLNLSPGSAYAIAVMNLSATDKVAVNFMSLKSGSGSGSGSGDGDGNVSNPNPIPDPNAVGKFTYTQLAASGGVFATSCFGCHSNNRQDGGLNLQNYAAAKVAAQNIKSRVTNAANPMPISGLLPQAQRNCVTSWVDGGAPQ